MKKIRVMLNFLIFINVVSSAIKLSDGTEIKGEIISKYDNGNIEKIKLENPVLISTKAGKLKFKDELSFYENGNIEWGDLSEQQVIVTPLGKLIAEKSINFYENGNISFSELPDIEQSVSILSGIYKINGNINFYENGKLAYCYFKEPQFINTPSGNLKIRSIGLHENGTIGNVILYNDKELIDTPLGKLDVVMNLQYYETGRLKSFYLLNPQIIETPVGKLNIESEIVFYESGKINYIKLEKPFFIKKKPYNFKVCNFIDFYESGNIRMSQFTDLIKIKTLYGELPAERTFVLYESGKIMGLELSEKTTIITSVGKIIAKYLIFFEDGKLKVLSPYLSTVIINDKGYSNYLLFSKTGEFLGEAEYVKDTLEFVLKNPVH